MFLLILEGREEREIMEQGKVSMGRGNMAPSSVVCLPLSLALQSLSPTLHY